MARHADLAANIGVRVYFCDPHSPWQRGTCEDLDVSAWPAGATANELQIRRSAGGR